MLFEMDNFLIFAKEDQVDGEQHANGVYAFAGYNPHGGAIAGPSFGLAQQTYETADIIVGYGSVRSDKGLTVFVVHVHGALMLIFAHTRVVPWFSSSAFLIIRFACRGGA